MFIKADCRLRNDEVKHFNMSQIINHRKVPKKFVEYFVSKK